MVFDKSNCRQLMIAKRRGKKEKNRSLMTDSYTVSMNRPNAGVLLA